MSTPDFYSRARRQGASNYVALGFEAYAYRCLDLGIKPVSCRRFLDSLDLGSFAQIIKAFHTDRAAEVMAAPELRSYRDYA